MKDAIYKGKGIVPVPATFCLDAGHPFPYPPDNHQIFEEWFLKNFGESDVRDRIYLPIFWTGYYVRANYGKDSSKINVLQYYLDHLDRSLKYYTIVQYDDGILNHVEHLDIKVYSMSGTPVDYSLPLLCQPHAYQFDCTRDIFMSFVGRNNHRFRDIILKKFAKDSDCYVTEKYHSLEDYCKILARSVFALCPRGYGPTSFRIAEALQYGAIPVAISDILILPHLPLHNLPPACHVITFSGKELDNLRRNLENPPPSLTVAKLLAKIPSYYDTYYSYEGNKTIILKTLEHGTDKDRSGTYQPDPAENN